MLNIIESVQIYKKSNLKKNKEIPSCLTVPLDKDYDTAKSYILTKLKGIGLHVNDAPIKYSIALRDFYNINIIFTNLGNLSTITIQVEKKYSTNNIRFIHLFNDSREELKLKDLYYLSKINGEKTIMDSYMLNMSDNIDIFTYETVECIFCEIYFKQEEEFQ